MFWRIEDNHRIFRQYKEIGEWINILLTQLRSSNGAKITTLLAPYCMIWTWNNHNWILNPVNEKIEI